MTFALKNDTASVLKLNKQVHTSGEKFAALLHEAAFNCIAHVANHGDIRPLQHLFDGLKPRAKQALGAYAAKYCPRVKFDHKAGSFGVKKTDDATDFEAIQEIGPMEYVPVKAAAQPKPFDLQKEIERLLNRATEKRPDAAKAIGFLNSALKAAA